jgi:hypothetical protein
MARKPTPVSQAAGRPEAPADEQVPANQAADQTEAKAEELQAEPAEPGTIPARILLDHGDYKCNTLALITETEAENCADWADTSRAAVQYVASVTPPEELEPILLSLAGPEELERLKAAFQAIAE